MKLFLFLILVVFSCRGQDLEKNKDFSKYSSIVDEHVQTNWITKHFLSNGKLSRKEIYSYKRLMGEMFYLYDTFGNRKFEIKNYDANNGSVNDTIEHYKYDSEGRLIESNYKGSTTLYSEFNRANLPQKINSSYSTTDLRYDSRGNILIEITILSIGRETDTATIHYEYNQYDDVIALKRSYKPQRNFPIWVYGELPYYEVEHFRYVYNKYGLWIKKYVTLDGDEFLVCRRKYRKKSK